MVAPTRSRALRPRPPRRSAPRLRPVRVVLVHALDKRKAGNDRVDEQRLAEVLPLPADPPRRYCLGSNAAARGMGRARVAVLTAISSGHRMPPGHRHRPVLQRACGRELRRRLDRLWAALRGQARALRVSTRTAAPSRRRARGNPACSQYQSCLGACVGDPQCRSQCTVDNRIGAAGSSAECCRRSLWACLVSHCSTECALSCGDMAAYVAPRCVRALREVLSVGLRPDHGACASSVDCDAYTRVSSWPVRRPIAGKPAPPRTTPGLRSFAPVQQACAGSCARRRARTGTTGTAVSVTSSGRLSRAPRKCTRNRSLTMSRTRQSRDWTCSSARVAQCSTPINIVLAHGQTDDAGTITLPVPFYVNAAGVPATECAQSTSPANPPTIVPTLDYYSFPPSEPTFMVTSMFFQTLASQVLTPDESAQYYMTFGLRQDPMRGQLAALVYDCLGSLAAGVQVRTTNLSDAGGVSVEGVTDAGTSSSGLISFDNMPPGSSTLTATPRGLGKPASVFTANVAAGTLTGVDMFPTP